MRREKATAVAIAKSAVAGAQAIARACVKLASIRASAERLEKAIAAAIAKSAEDKADEGASGAFNPLLARHDYPVELHRSDNSISSAKGMSSVK